MGGYYNRSGKISGGTAGTSSGSAFGTDLDTAAGLGAASSNTSKAASQEDLEPFKTYVVGTAFDAGSGYPETWQDQPYSTGHGQTQMLYLCGRVFFKSFLDTAHRINSFPPPVV